MISTLSSYSLQVLYAKRGKKPLAEEMTWANQLHPYLNVVHVGEPEFWHALTAECLISQTRSCFFDAFKLISRVSKQNTYKLKQHFDCRERYYFTGKLQ